MADASWEFKEDLGDFDETKKAVESAESRALFETRSETKVKRRNDREFGRALHREADQLYHKGDYETALVLYHRAANVFPRDGSHSVAARRTAAMISSWNNPAKASKKLLPNVRAELRLTRTLCSDSAVVATAAALKKEPADLSSVYEALSHLDSHNLSRKPSATPHLTRSRPMLRQLNTLANLSLKSLEATYTSGRMTAALKTAEELLTLSSGLRDPRRYQITAYDYLSLIHVALGRHDRAVSSVSRLVRLSKSTGDVVQTCRSLVTVGKVHLSFGHLDAAARAWEHLARDLKESVPRAWIRHEIGRCHLERGKFRKAMEMADRCVEAAADAGSSKWTLRGKLLVGQSLAKLGRFAEALEELKIAAQVAEEEGDAPMLTYVQEFGDQVAKALRKVAEDPATRCTTPENGSMTTVFSQRKLRLRDQSSSEDETVSSRSSTMSSRGDPDEDEVSPGRTGGESPRLDSGEDAKSECESEHRIVEANLKESLTSMKSDQTNLTYVIACEMEHAKEIKSASANDDKQELSVNEKRIAESGKSLESSPRKSEACDKALREKKDLLNAIRMIENLDKKEDRELLVMLKDMMLTSEEDRLEGFVDLDSLPKSVEREFACDKTVMNRALYKHSLPSSPRKFEDDMVSHTCEGTETFSESL